MGKLVKRTAEADTPEHAEWRDKVKQVKKARVEAKRVRFINTDDPAAAGVNPEAAPSSATLPWNSVSSSAQEPEASSGKREVARSQADVVDVRDVRNMHA